MAAVTARALDEADTHRGVFENITSDAVTQHKKRPGVLAHKKVDRAQPTRMVAHGRPEARENPLAVAHLHCHDR